MNWEPFLGAGDITSFSHVTGVVGVMLTFELPDLITPSHLVCCTCTPKTVLGVRLFMFLVLFLICFYCCVSILFFLLILGLRSCALLGFLPLPLGFCAIFGDYKAIVATLGPGECDLVLPHTLPVAMSDPSAILHSKWDTLPWLRPSVCGQASQTLPDPCLKRQCLSTNKGRSPQ